MDFDTSAYDQRKEALEAKDQIETIAAAAVAQTNLEQAGQIYNSYDGGMDRDGLEADKPSFLRRNPDDFGINDSVLHKWAPAGASPGRDPSNADDDFRQNNDREVKSEVDATEKQVKRSNLIDMFLRGTAVDQYIVENLYGRDRYAKSNNPSQTLGDASLIEALNLDETFTHQMQLLHKRSFIGIEEPGDSDKRKLTAFETYVALIKGYCALMILVLPKSFTTGGYIFSPIALLLSATVQVIAGIKLVRTGQSLGLTSYSLITLKVLGPSAKKLLDFMIAATQFSFTLSFVSFISTAWKSLAHELLGVDMNIWAVAAIAVFILTLLAWIRDISKFSFTMLIGNLCILSTIIIVSTVMTGRFIDKGYEFGEGIVAWNKNEYWAMVGFSCYAFEGIGVVMPIMTACSCPEKFDKIYLAALLTLTAAYILFSNWTYLVMGSKITHTFITEELDQKSSIVEILQGIYSLNLVCSYAIFIFPANQILEDYLFKGMRRKEKTVTREEAKKLINLRYYLSNFTRFLMCLTAAYMALELHDKLNKFLSVLGALLCAPLAILLPGLLHLKQVTLKKRDWTKCQVAADLGLVITAVVVMVFSTMQVIESW